MNLQSKFITPKFMEFGINEMQGVIIIAKGDVQGVNYRKVVEKIARKLNIVGYVENLKPYDVRIVAEGKKENLDKFIEEIRIKKPPILVKEIDPKYGKATGKFKYFEIKRGDIIEELGERIDIAGGVMYEIRDLQEEAIKKQDKTIETLNTFKEETNNNFTMLRDDYGRISKDLARAIEGIESMAVNLEKLTKAVVALAEKSGK